MHKRYLTATLAVLLASAGLAACGGSKSPGVASLAGSHDATGGVTTTTLPHGSPTQLLDEWANCMRQHGAPNQADPTIDANGVIHIQFSTATANSASFDLHGGACGAYLTAASTALRGGQPLQAPDPAKLLKFSECMRSHGIPDFPDPNGHGLSIQSHPGSDLDPNNPTFQAASKTCAKKTGVPAFGVGQAPRGAIEATSGGPGPGGGQIAPRSNQSGIAAG